MTSPSSPTAASTSVCPGCGATGHGRYCANCGVPLAGATCTSCSAELSPRAKFCHRCGSPAGAAPLAGLKTNSLPWIVAALAFLALFAMAAGRGFNAKRSSTVDGSANALPQAGLDDRAGGDDQSASARAPDISSLSPQE